MNGTAARRSASTAKVAGSKPREQFADGLLPVPMLPDGRGRRRSRVRGLSGEIAYAAMDAATVCLVGEVVVLLRFGIGLPFATRPLLFDLAVGKAYAGFFLLYAAVI